ncbi:hypothetical protein B0T14DRAFT_434938, partial [Immersiella caudata]
KKAKTYNTRDSLVVTDPTTSLAVTGLSMGERTGSRAFQYLWSYVLNGEFGRTHILLSHVPKGATSGQRLERTADGLGSKGRDSNGPALDSTVFSTKFPFTSPPLGTPQHAPMLPYLPLPHLR